MKKRLNKNIRGKQILAFVSKYEKKNGYAPTYAEIAKQMKLSMQQIFNIVKDLEIKGLIIKSEDQIRKLVVVK